MLRIRWVILALSIIVLGVLGIIAIESFLACNSPVEAESLIVEGWLDSFYMPMAVEEFRRGGYRHIFVVGCLPASVGPYTGPANNAEHSAQALIQLGIDPSLITVITALPVEKRKTWSLALALQDYIVSSGYVVKTANVFTLWVHARKSLVLYQKALGPTVQVGVIPAKHKRFGHERWWLSQRGINLVARYIIGYLDALLLKE